MEPRDAFRPGSSYVAAELLPADLDDPPEARKVAEASATMGTIRNLHQIGAVRRQRQSNWATCSRSSPNPTDRPSLQRQSLKRTSEHLSLASGSLVPAARYDLFAGLWDGKAVSSRGSS